VSLDFYRKDLKGNVWKASLCHRNDVPDNGAGGRGYNADFSRKKGNRFFPGLIKQALLGKLLLELFKGCLEGAGAFRLHVLKDELVGAPGLVEAEPSHAGDLHAVFRSKPKPASLVPEHDTGDDGVGIL